MGRRDYSVRVQCSHDGCSEVTHFGAQTRREEADIRRRYSNTWKCLRHGRPDEVLSISNRRRVTTIEARPSTRYPNLKGLYWSTGSGFASGAGWKAWADDFPEGTKIRVTVEVVLPGEDGAVATFGSAPVAFDECNHICRYVSRGECEARERYHCDVKCPSEWCPFCSGSLCRTHGGDACECDVVDRHEEAP